MLVLNIYTVRLTLVGSTRWPVNIGEFSITIQSVGCWTFGSDALFMSMRTQQLYSPSVFAGSARWSANVRE